MKDRAVLGMARCDDSMSIETEDNTEEQTLQYPLVPFVLGIPVMERDDVV